MRVGNNKTKTKSSPTQTTWTQETSKTTQKAKKTTRVKYYRRMVTFPPLHPTPRRAYPTFSCPTPAWSWKLDEKKQEESRKLGRWMRRERDILTNLKLLPWSRHTTVVTVRLTTKRLRTRSHYRHQTPRHRRVHVTVCVQTRPQLILPSPLTDRINKKTARHFPIPAA